VRVGGSAEQREQARDARRVVLDQGAYLVLVACAPGRWVEAEEPRREL